MAQENAFSAMAPQKSFLSALTILRITIAKIGFVLARQSCRDFSGGLAAFDASVFPTQPARLFVLLGPLRLTKADARAAAILVNELDASIF
jgi:hypothetical protein